MKLLLRQMAALGAARLRAGVADLFLLFVIGLCLMTAAAFGLAATYSLLHPILGPAGASGVMTAGLSIVALVLALWLSLRRKAVPVPLEMPTVAPATPDAAASAAFLAGFLLARRLF